MSPGSPHSPYKRLNYRRLIAWPARIEREGPFLEAEIRRAPEPSVIDLGCGTGEHCRHLAERGFKAVGVDRSREQIAKARDYTDEYPPHGPRFLCGELETLDELTDERFGAAICLGNVLPHLDDLPLERALTAVAARLAPEGRLLLQILNYERIFRRGDRYLPLNVRDNPEGGGEIVFLRLMKPDGDSHVRFFPSTLLLRPGDEPPLEVKSTKEVRLRAWRQDDLEVMLCRHGFRVAERYGDMKRAPFDAESSNDLVLVAVREDKSLRDGRDDEN